MISCQPIEAYVQYTREYPDKVCQKVHLLVNNVILPTLQREDITFNRQMYDDCVEYVEKYYYPLFPYQRMIYASFFLFDSEDMVVFRTIVLVMGRGNGKDGFMAPLVNFLQTDKYGVKKYHIDIVANAEQQALDTFDVVYEMMTEKNNIEKFKKFFYISHEKIVNRKTMSRLRYNTSNSGTKDGKQTGLILFNEYHGYEDNRQIAVFESGAGKVRHFRKVVISTQGDVSDGPLDELLSTCELVLKGELKELRYFPFINMLDNPGQVDDPENWRLANPSYDYLPDLRNELMMQYIELKTIPSKRPTFMTKRMNWPEREEEVTVSSWHKILRTSFDIVRNDDGSETITKRKIPDLNGRLAICGLDFSDLRDFTSAGFLFYIDGEIIWISRTWICSRSPFYKGIKFPMNCAGQPGYEDFVIVNGPSIDYNEVVDWVVEQMQKYNVVKIIMDSHRFKMVQRCFETRGVSLEDKLNPYGLVRMIRNFPSVMSMTAPVIEYNFAEEKIIAGDSAMWRWSVNNTGVKMDGNGNKNFFKIEPLLRKNDAFMAFAAAMSELNMIEEKVIYF